MQLHGPTGWLSRLAARAVDLNDNGSRPKTGIGNLAADICQRRSAAIGKAGPDAPANTTWNFQ